MLVVTGLIIGRHLTVRTPLSAIKGKSPRCARNNDFDRADLAEHPCADRARDLTENLKLISDAKGGMVCSGGARHNRIYKSKLPRFAVDDDFDRADLAEHPRTDRARDLTENLKLISDAKGGMVRSGGARHNQIYNSGSPRFLLNTTDIECQNRKIRLSHGCNAT